MTQIQAYLADTVPAGTAVGTTMGMGSAIGAREIHDLWLEYEEHATVESLVVHDLDKFEMICQAWEYEKRHSGHGGGVTLRLDPFFDSTSRHDSFRTTTGHQWSQELRARRQRYQGEHQEHRRQLEDSK